MATQHDFKKEWAKTRIQLAKFSKEAAKLAKKGEEELVEFSRKSKIHVDATATGLQKEKLYYLIGKEYAQAKASEAPTPKLKKLLDELKKVDRHQNALKRKLKKSGKTKSA